MDHGSTITGLHELGGILKDEAAGSHTGRAVHTFDGAHEGRLHQHLVALEEGRRLEEHDNPGEAMLQVLEGRARLIAGDDAWEPGPGEHVVIPQRRHELLAVEDLLVLITTCHAQD